MAARQDYVKLVDGTIIYVRGKPGPIPGYEVDPENEKRFLPIIPECDYRDSKSVKLACGKLKGHYCCTLKQCEVTRLFCSQCKEYKKNEQ